MSDNEDFEEKRTEGVRIIGAQEAAEAAGRPDVVRRRRRTEKRFGDRPDKPEPASDLPKIKISTTEGDPSANPDRFGSVPVVRPSSSDQEPVWAEEHEELYGPTDDDGRRIAVGHARIVPAEGETGSVPDDAQSSDPETVRSADVEDETFAAPSSVDDQDDAEPDDGYVERSGDDREADEAPVEPDHGYVARSGDDREADEAPVEPDDGYVGEDTEAWDVSPALDDGPEVFDDAFEQEEPFEAGPLEDRDDSFVLPHWTEPPTGQVPKVVIGELGPEPDVVASYGNQPRWRGEGERHSATDFGDLIDDGPRLGALGNDSDSDYDSDDDDDDDDDDFFSSEHFGSFDETEITPPEDEYEDSDESEGGRRQRVVPQRRQAAPVDEEEGGSGDRNLPKALLVGVALVGVGLFCFWLGALATALLVTAILTVAAIEYFNAVRDSGYNPAALLGIPAVAGIVFAAYTNGLSGYPVVLGLTVIAALLWYVFVVPGEYMVPNLSLTLLGVLWIGFLGSFATLLLGLGANLQDADPTLKSNPGIGVILAAAVVAVSHDVGAYFIGRQWGNTPFSVASPNKTLEGLAGGVLSAFVVTVVVVGAFGINPIGESLAKTVVFALICALVAPLGDLCESAIKRDLGTKDMSGLLPGHGGILDRFDAMLFVLPAAYFVTVILDIWTVAKV